MGQNLLDGPDAFGGSNGDTLSTYNAKWSVGGSFANEVAIRGTPGIGANGQACDKNTGQTWTNDQWCELKVDATHLADNIFAIYVRLTGDGSTAANGYGAGKDVGSLGDDIRIWTMTNNAKSTLAVNATVLALNDVLNFQVVGNQLTVRLNGTILTGLDISDATFPSGGNPGIELDHSNAVDRLAGTWKAGSVSGAVTDAQEWLSRTTAQKGPYAKQIGY